MAKQRPKKKPVSRKPEPETPANPFSQKPADAMHRMLNAGNPGAGLGAGAHSKQQPDMHLRPNASKPMGQPRQRGRRV